MRAKPLGVLLVLFLVLLVSAFYLTKRLQISLPGTKPKTSAASCEVSFSTTIPGYAVELDDKKYLCNLLNGWGVFGENGLTVRDRSSYYPASIKRLEIVLVDEELNLYREYQYGPLIWASDFLVEDDTGRLKVFIGEKIFERPLAEVSALASGYISRALYLSNVLTQRPIDSQAKEEMLSIRTKIQQNSVSFFSLKKI